MRTNLKRLEEIISEIHTLSSEAAVIIEANPKLLKIVEEETQGSFLSIGCDCCEAEAAIDKYRSTKGSDS